MFTLMFVLCLDLWPAEQCSVLQCVDADVCVDRDAASSQDGHEGVSCWFTSEMTALLFKMDQLTSSYLS